MVARRFALRSLEYPEYAKSMAEMVLTWPSLLLFYARLLLFPNAVSPHYNLKVVTAFSFKEVVLPGLAVVGLAGLILMLLWRFTRRGGPEAREAARVAGFAIVWMLAGMAPVMYLRTMQGDDFAHIRYLYLSTVGLALAAGLIFGVLPWGRLRLLGRLHPRTPKTRACWGPRPAGVAAAAVLLTVSAVATVQNQMHWRDNYALFTHAIRFAPDNSNALTDYGVELGRRGQFDEALKNLHRALELNPKLWYAHLNLANTYLLLGRYEEARTYLMRGLPLMPRDALQYLYLATVNARLGRMEEAERAAREGIARAPRNAEYRYALGVVLEQQRRFGEAAEEYRSALEINSGHARARARLAALPQRSASER
jgi:Tfp pilus assembly protein PilF